MNEGGRARGGAEAQLALAYRNSRQEVQAESTDSSSSWPPSPKFLVVSLPQDLLRGHGQGDLLLSCPQATPPLL